MGLAGIFPVLCTPFDTRGEIDEASLRRLVEFAIGAGVHGLVVGGIASEVYKLSEAERESTMRIVIGQAAGRVPVVVGGSADATELAVRVTRLAKEAGAAAVMVMPPTTIKHGPPALLQHFTAIGEVGLPIMVQDHPGLSGVQMPAAFLAELINQIPAVESVKVEAPPTGPKGSQVMKLVQRPVQILGGLGGQNFAEELRRGFVGTLPGASMPEVYVAMYRAWQDGRAHEARAIHNRFVPLMRFISQSVEFSFHAYKEILRRRGIIATAYVRRPSTSFDEINHAELTDLLQAADLDGLALASKG